MGDAISTVRRNCTNSNCLQHRKQSVNSNQAHPPSTCGDWIKKTPSAYSRTVFYQHQRTERREIPHPTLGIFSKPTFDHPLYLPSVLPRGERRVIHLVHVTPDRPRLQMISTLIPTAQGSRRYYWRLRLQRRLRVAIVRWIVHLKARVNAVARDCWLGSAGLRHGTTAQV